MKVQDEKALRKCPHCGSHNIGKNGFRMTLAGKKQRYQCMNCGRTFY
jgi:transposase-like protein